MQAIAHWTGRALARISAVFGTIMVGVLAGGSVAALGTKAVVLVPALAFVAMMMLVPYSPLVGIVFTIPINVEIAGPITVSRLLIVLGFFVAILQAVKGQMRPFNLPREGYAAIGFFVWVAFVAVALPGGSLVERVGPYIVHGAIFFVVLAYADTPQRIRLVFLTLVVSAVGQGLLAVAEARFGFAPFGGWHAKLAEDRGDTEIRVTATASHAIVLAGFLQIVMVVVGMFLLTARRFLVRVLLLGILGLLLIAWWYTFARSSWIGMAVLGFVAMMILHPVTRTLGLIGGTVGFVVLAAHSFSMSAVIDTVESLATLQAASKTAGVTAGSESFSWRTENWTAAYNMWVRNPLTGVGIEQSDPQMPNYLPRGALAHQFIAHTSPHNMFLMVASEGGTPAILFYVLMWVAAFRGIARAWSVPELKVYAMTVLVMASGHLGTFTFNPLAREGFLIMALGMALGRIARERHEATAPLALSHRMRRFLPGPRAGHGQAPAE